MTKNYKLIKMEKPTVRHSYNKNNILNRLFSYKKTYEFEFDGNFDVHNKKGYFVITRYFTGLKVAYFVDTGNRSFWSNNLQTAMMGALEHAMVGYIKYILLKDDVRKTF